MARVQGLGWTHDECWDEHGKCPACGGVKSLSQGAAPKEATPVSPEALEKSANLRTSNVILGAVLLAVLGGTIATLVSLIVR